ncbi:hypothetical protein EON66_06510 [archaeon]|nr:MAG: hypothetical protein EON66_06510 [archaeon]
MYTQRARTNAHVAPTYCRRFVNLANQMGLPLKYVARLFGQAQEHYDTLLVKTRQFVSEQRRRARAAAAFPPPSGGGGGAGGGGGEGGPFLPGPVTIMSSTSSAASALGPASTGAGANTGANAAPACSASMAVLSRQQSLRRGMSTFAHMPSVLEPISET